MPALNELYILTSHMIEKFEGKEPREELVRALNYYVNERENLLKEISGPYTEKESEIGRELVKLDQRLQELVNEYYSEFKVDLSNLNKKRQSNKKYVNPYANVFGTDGHFIDKKN